MSWRTSKKYPTEDQVKRPDPVDCKQVNFSSRTHMNLMVSRRMLLSVYRCVDDKNTYHVFQQLPGGKRRYLGDVTRLGTTRFLPWHVGRTFALMPEKNIEMAAYEIGKWDEADVR